MPKGPKGQRRLADVIGNAVKIAQIAPGEIEDEPEAMAKTQQRKRLGRRAERHGRRS